MQKYRGNLNDQWIDFKYWCLNWGAILKYVAANPYRAVIGLFKYAWIYDLLKANHWGKVLNEGRNGSSLHMSLMALNSVVKCVTGFLKMFVFDTRDVIFAHIMVPPQIYQAMGLKWFNPELPASLSSLLDQHTSEKYMDLIESEGLPGDTCSWIKISAGVHAAGEMPTGPKAMVAANLACEAGFSMYNEIQRKENVPTYRLDIPNDFKSEDGLKALVQDIRGMISFLEEKTGHRMDWDRLREICGRFNEMQELELERWEFARGEVPALAGENLWMPHLYYFNLDAGSPGSIDIYRKLHRHAKAAYQRKEPAVKNMRYRTVLWNPPNLVYLHMFNWLERCWGVACLNDMETFGNFSELFIDTSTEDSMLAGLARSWSHMTMVRNTRGKVENYIPELFRMGEMFKADFILVAAHIGCRSSMAMTGVVNEEARKRNVPVCVADYDLMDPRVCSRQGFRDQINTFMMTVMKAEPLDPNLLVIDDEAEW